MAEKEMSEETPGEMPEKAMSEKERTAAERWKIEEDTETETIAKESEIKATEGGKGGMAKARRGVTHSSNEGNAAGEGRKSRGNGMSWVDSRGFGGHATDSSVLKGRSRYMKQAVPDMADMWQRAMEKLWRNLCLRRTISPEDMQQKVD